MAGRQKKGEKANATRRVVYAEFDLPSSEALQRAVPDLTPEQQSLKVEVSRKGRKGKTVTMITGFQHAPETLTKLAKELKAKCGTGGTVKEQTIEIQGEHAPKLLTLLTHKGYHVKRSGG